MALVFRKAVLPKNVSLLKCFKGRPLATAANKSNPAALSAAVPSRSLRTKNKTLPLGTLKIKNTKQLPSVLDDCGRSVSAPLRFCMSCPHLAPDSRARFCVSPVCCNPSRTRSIRHELLNPPARRAISSPYLMPSQYFHTTKTSEFAKPCCPPPCSCGCPCSFPCGPCGNSCLPPPGPSPPKCIQYMTGYYYYPYGYWFCGPYHVTGTCTPVGPCGPCPPSCPPSPPCCPCPKCCACLSPVAAVMGCSPMSPQGQPFPCAATSRPMHSNVNIKYPLPQQDVRYNSTLPVPREPATSQPRPRSGGISKLFPFNAVVPAMPAARDMPDTSPPLCPYTAKQCEQPKATEFPEHIPVYYTPCIKQSKSNFNTRPRPPFFSNSQKPKRYSPSGLSKSYSDYYEKRNEIRSPIYHKRSKKYNCELCPLLESPRGLQSQKERDQPTVYPGAFQYTNIPNFRRPFPNTGARAGYRYCD